MTDTHVQTGIPTTIEARFYDANGVLADDGTPTIGIAKADGSVLVASGTATTSGGPGIRRFALAAQAEVNRLKATWTGTAQTVVTSVEVVGDVLFPLASLRAVKVGNATPFNNQTDYPTQTLLDRRVEVTDDFEARCGWSFVPRFARQVLNGDGSNLLILSRRKCSKLLSVTINGVVQDLAKYTLSSNGMVRVTSNFLPVGTFQGGIANVIVEYAHGFDRPPAEISDVGLARTAMLLLPNQAGATASTWTTPDGTTYSYDQAGQSVSGGGRRHYGVPRIDSTLNARSYSAPVVG